MPFGYSGIPANSRISIFPITFFVCPWQYVAISERRLEKISLSAIKYSHLFVIGILSPFPLNSTCYYTFGGSGWLKQKEGKRIPSHPFPASSSAHVSRPSFYFIIRQKLPIRFYSFICR